MKRRARAPTEVWCGLRDSLHHWPDAALLLDPEGRVTLANPSALRQWQRDGQPLQGQHAHTVLSALRRRSDGAPMLPHDALSGRPRPTCDEGEDAEGRGLLLRCLPLLDERQGLHGWLVVLVDVTPMWQAERQRDEALRFLSHDARKSATTILAMLDLSRQRAEAAVADGWLLQGIQREAQAGLDSSDRFVAQARMQSRPLHIESLDLCALLRLVVDAAWATAQRQQVRILALDLPDEANCMADRGMLTRALGAMLDHAINHAPPGAALQWGITANGGQWRMCLTEPTACPPAQGQLQLVRTVAQRHGGRLEIDHAAGAGCTLSLMLPGPASTELAAPAALGTC